MMLPKSIRPRLLYWHNGSAPSVEDRTAAHALGAEFHVMFRNADVADTGGLELCDACAGAVPDRYGKYPSVETYEASKRRKIGDVYQKEDGQWVRLDMAAGGLQEIAVDPPTPKDGGVPNQPPFQGTAPKAHKRKGPWRPQA